MTLKRLVIVKLCHYALCGITFISLFVLCYFLYMDEAIKQSKIRATTLIKRPEEYELELPTITICPEPGFKPSISQMYNLSKPARLLFWYKEASDGFSTNKTIQGVQNKKHIQEIILLISLNLFSKQLNGYSYCPFQYNHFHTSL